MFNSTTEEYVNKLKDGDFTLLRAEIYFTPEQQYDHYGRRVAYDGRIYNNMAHPVCLTAECQFHHSGAQSHGMTNRQIIDFKSGLPIKKYFP